MLEFLLPIYFVYFNFTMELSAVNALLTFIILCGVANIGKYQGIRKAKVGKYLCRCALCRDP